MIEIEEESKMLQALELENFKAFGERTRIPFAPITLLFGENSAGKSSVLQALNLLKQTRESREMSALLLPRAENGIVDLGSFQELLFDHDLNRTLSIRVETKRNMDLAIEFSFKRPSLDAEVLLAQIEIYDSKTSRSIAIFRPSGIMDGPDELMMRIGLLGDSQAITTSKLVRVECVWVTENDEYWKEEYNWCLKYKKEILGWIKERITDLETLVSQQSNVGEEFDESVSTNEQFSVEKNKIREDLNILKEKQAFYSSDFQFENYIANRRMDEMKTVVGFQGFLPVGIINEERYSPVTSLHSSLPNKGGVAIYNVTKFLMNTSQALETSLKDLFPMGPFRRPPERWYIFTGTSPQDVGYQGDLLPDLLLRRPNLVKVANEWLNRLDMGYELEVKSVGANIADLFEVRLIDTRRKERINVALPDVGFGISQLLPFVVQSLVSKQQIISIEQPEVHVHPRLQADLGDLLVESIKAPRHNQFIVETHSEHLILRLQRLVREQKLKHDDVSVIYISRTPDGAKSQRLNLDKEGDFIDDWPNGFFPERLRELI